MLYRLFIASCLIVHLGAISQTNFYTKKQNSIGQTNALVPISATTFSFGYSFYDALYDSTSKRLYFSTRAKDATGKVFTNTAYQFCLDVSNDSIVWTNEVHKFELSKINHYLFYSNETKTGRFNKRSGFEQYEYPSRIFFTDDATQLGLTYNNKGNADGEERLKCLQLEDGSLRWSSAISRAFDWNEVKYLNDSVLLVAASGIHGIHLRTGKTWSHPLITGDTNLKRMVFSPITPESSTLGKPPFLGSPLENVVTQLSSNILMDGNRIYYAGKDKLLCLDDKGQLLWSTDISVSPTSKSFLFINGNDLSLFNLGVASFKDRIIEYGKPYLIGMDKLSGKVNFNQSLSLFNSPVDFKIEANTLFVATREKMYQFNIANGDMMYMLEFNERQYGRFLGFVDGNSYCVEKEGFYVTLNFINDKSIYFKTDHGKVYGLEKNEIAYEYQISELFELDVKTKNYRLLNQKDDTYIVSSNWELVAKLKTGSKAMYLNDKLYYPVGRQLHVIKLNEIQHGK